MAVLGGDVVIKMTRLNGGVVICDETDGKTKALC